MVPQPPNILICLVLVWFPKVVLLNIRRYEKIKSWLSMAWESIRTRYLHQHGIRHAWASRTGGARVFLTPGVGFCVYVEYKVRFQWCLSWTWDFACVYFRLGVGVDGARVSGGVVEVRQHGVRGSLCVLVAWPVGPPRNLLVQLLTRRVTRKQRSRLWMSLRFQQPDFDEELS